ncbi:hypothetical protein AVEN_58614-1 [Araneus ventricosus]|uniref:Uncharacterized protein n=1 Tax=Araneus ventricosus TaxID=182803 RepID=A0A4Y2QQT2_ARAVE|nr:hypothetical protein AVEN_237946-1 [Araneus ventricosus]GBN65628.1 hypothetical protein AVEN_58614-1 [Araneus ventricosus]
MKKLNAKQSRVSKESFLDTSVKTANLRPAIGLCLVFASEILAFHQFYCALNVHVVCSERLLGIVSVDDNSTGVLSLNVASSVVINSLRKDDYSISKSLHYIESYAWSHRCVTLS